MGAEPLHWTHTTSQPQMMGLVYGSSATVLSSDISSGYTYLGQDSPLLSGQSL